MSCLHILSFVGVSLVVRSLIQSQRDLSEKLDGKPHKIMPISRTVRVFLLGAIFVGVPLLALATLSSLTTIAWAKRGKLLFSTDAIGRNFWATFAAVIALYIGNAAMLQFG